MTTSKSLEFQNKLCMMDAGETISLLTSEDPTIEYDILRVPGGYIYNRRANENGTWHITSTFVPF